MMMDPMVADDLDGDEVLRIVWRNLADGLSFRLQRMLAFSVSYDVLCMYDRDEVEVSAVNDCWNLDEY